MKLVLYRAATRPSATTANVRTNADTVLKDICVRYSLIPSHWVARLIASGAVDVGMSLKRTLSSRRGTVYELVRTFTSS